ncbi:uncharacterized protein PG986_014682 [Apiospora aurea]|uniref:Uncharacterized protein n=1 Tax=Apiospora aurea TaxID=335848 RepID=A0ABR1PTQ0_9PEZI
MMHTNDYHNITSMKDKSVNIIRAFYSAGPVICEAPVDSRLVRTDRWPSVNHDFILNIFGEKGITISWSLTIGLPPFGPSSV